MLVECRNRLRISSAERSKGQLEWQFPIESFLISDSNIENYLQLTNNKVYAAFNEAVTSGPDEKLPNDPKTFLLSFSQMLF